MKTYAKMHPVFDLNQFTMRELQTLLIVLRYEGESLPNLKNIIDLEFKHRSRTKGYDYINNLCRRGFIYKKNLYNRGNEITCIFVHENARRQYEKFILPTFKDVKEAHKNLLDDYLSEIRDVEKFREKFSSYTQCIKNSITTILRNSPLKEKENKHLQKKILRELENHLKVELVKYQIFSE
jgi:hypothetical protein